MNSNSNQFNSSNSEEIYGSPFSCMVEDTTEEAIYENLKDHYDQ